MKGLFTLRAAMPAALAGLLALVAPAMAAPIAPAPIMEAGPAAVQVRDSDAWRRRAPNKQHHVNRSDNRRYHDARRAYDHRRYNDARRGYDYRRPYDGRRGVVYDERRYGPRYTYRHGPYRHYYNGYYYSTPWWLGAAAGVGAAVGAVVNTIPSGDSHVAWCQSRYRTYDPRTDTYIGKGGRAYRCVSP